MADEQADEQVEKQEPRVSRFSEVGRTGLDRAAGRIYEEMLNQLRSPSRRTKTFKEMATNDPIVWAMLFAIEMMLKQVEWTVEPGGEDTEDEEAAEFLETVPDDMSHAWSDFIGEWMAAPVFGFAPFEVVYKRREGAKERPGESSRFDDGFIGVRKLAIRHPDTLHRWRFDDAGGVQAMVQRPPPTFETLAIPIEKMLLFRMRGRKNNPEGTSLLRGAYRPWYFKKRIEEIEAIGIERDLAGLPMALVPPHLLHEDASSTDKNLLTEIKRIVRNVRRDEQEGLVFPLTYDENGNLVYDFKLLSTGGKRQFDTSAVVERYDRRIAMTLLADVILIGHEKVGSFALASSKTNLFAAGLGALLDDIQGVLNRHLVPRLMRLNGFRVTQHPEFRHGDIESVDLEALGDYVQKLAGAGFPLFPTDDGELERELLRAANLPEPETFPDLGRPLLEGEGLEELEEAA